MQLMSEEVGPGHSRGDLDLFEAQLFKVCDVFCVFTLCNRYFVTQGTRGHSSLADPFLASLDSRGWSSFRRGHTGPGNSSGPGLCACDGGARAGPTIKV